MKIGRKKAGRRKKGKKETEKGRKKGDIAQMVRASACRAEG